MEQIVGGPQPVRQEPDEIGTVDQEALRKSVEARRARREAAEERDADERSERPVTSTLRAAAKGEKVEVEEVHDATAFFLANKDDEDVTVKPTSLKLNLGTKSEPKFIRWEIVPVPDTEITKLRKESVKGTRAQRRRGDAEIDENLVARKIVQRGTIDPDLPSLARTLGFADPGDALHAYFRKFGKTGLITQISGEILSISGWDDEDIQEVESALG